MNTFMQNTMKTILDNYSPNTITNFLLIYELLSLRIFPVRVCLETSRMYATYSNTATLTKLPGMLI